jgi:hypothetical protein
MLPNQFQRVRVSVMQCQSGRDYKYDPFCKWCPVASFCRYFRVTTSNDITSSIRGQSNVGFTFIRQFPCIQPVQYHRLLHSEKLVDEIQGGRPTGAFVGRLWINSVRNGTLHTGRHFGIGCSAFFVVGLHWAELMPLAELLFTMNGIA